MKLNYLTYTITEQNGTVSNPTIHRIVTHICSKLNAKERELDSTVSGRKLYLCQNDTLDNIFYLMTPNMISDYRSRNKENGNISNLSDLIDDNSILEKVTYIYMDEKNPIIGINTSIGGASIDDFECVINQLLNKLYSNKYKFKLFKLKSDVNRKDASKMKMVTEANVKLNDSASTGIFATNFFQGCNLGSNVEISISIKRTSKKDGIEKDIEPLLKHIENDDSDFAKVTLRGKQNALTEAIKDFELDKSTVLFDIVKSTDKASIEEKIIEKRNKNQNIIETMNSYFERFDNIHSQPSCDFHIT